MHICPFIEQYTAKLNTPPTRDSRENRLSFFYADRQKGATSHDETVILSRLVDTFISRISLTMLPVPNPHNTVCVLSWEEARHWQSRSSGYSSS